MDSNEYESRIIDESRHDNPYNGMDNGKDYTDKLKNFEEYDEIKSRNGVHGYIDNPTMFLAGEHGRERVSIHKSKKRKHNNQSIYNIDMLDVSKYFGGIL